MESFGNLRFGDTSKTVTKKRSSSTRRPRCDSQQFPDYRDNSSLSSTPPSGSASKASSDENTGHGTYPQKKELYLNQSSSRSSSTHLTEAETDLKTNNEDGSFGEFGGVNCSSRQSGVASEALGNDTKLKKVKLKVGGVTRTINPISTSDGASVGGSSSTKSSRSADAPRPRQRLILQDYSDEDSSPEKESGLRSNPWKDSSRSSLSVKKEVSFKGKMSEGSVSVKQSNKDEPVRKSKRIPKRRLLDGEFNDGDNDDEEIRYLEKLRTSKLSADYGEDDDEVGIKRHQKISRVLKRTVDDAGDYGLSRSNKEGKRSRSGKVYEDTDYLGEEEPVSDGEDVAKRKKQRKELFDVPADSKREMAVTTRQRALQVGKDISSSIEFPNGLPPVPPRKQKDKLTEVEQQLKKAEAAQRRRMQVEKAARESEAEAIRKILGQDSSRKKRENKIKRRQEELAEERAANAITLPSSTVRVVMGPSGTVVTFPNEMGLPSIFECKPCSYPPPREKCAAPSCSNPYRYRDSKSKLPLCSLLCYKAINERMRSVTAC